MTEIVRLDKGATKKLRKLIQRQKREVLEDELSKTHKVSPPNIFYDYPLSHFHGCHESKLLPTFIRDKSKSTPDLRTCSSKRSASVQTWSSSDCFTMYYPPSISTTATNKKCHDPIILPSKYNQSPLSSCRRSISTSRLDRIPTCDKAVQVRKSPVDPTKSMTNLPKKRLNDKLVLAAAERRHIAMNRSSVDVSSCRKSHPPSYDKNEVKDFMKMRQVMSKKLDNESRPLVCKKSSDGHPSRLLQRSDTRTILKSDAKPDDQEIIVNHSEVIVDLRPPQLKGSNSNNNITRHLLSADELKEIYDQIVKRNNLQNSSIKPPIKVNDVMEKPKIDRLDQSDDELPSFLKPKSIPIFDSIDDSWLPNNEGFDGEISSIVTSRRIEESPNNIFDDHSLSKLNNYLGLNSSFRHENSIQERERKDNSSTDQRQEFSRPELSKFNLENSRGKTPSSCDETKVSYDDILTNVLQKYLKEKSHSPSNDAQVQSHSSSSNSNNSYQAPDSPPTSSSDDSAASSDSEKSYTITSTTEPTTMSQSDKHGKLWNDSDSSPPNSSRNDLSISERINLICSQRNISLSPFEINEKSLAERENHIKSLRITPEIDLDEQEDVNVELSLESRKVFEQNENRSTAPINEMSDGLESKKEEVFDEDKYKISEEVVASLVREICGFIIINNQVQAPDDWKWKVSQKYNDNRAVENASANHIDQSMKYYPKLLCDLIESIMDVDFLKKDEPQFQIGCKSIKSIAKIARKKPLPKSPEELFNVINPVVLRTVGLHEPPKPSLSRDGILGYYKKNLDRDQVDVVALGDILDEDDDWLDYHKETDQIIDLITDKLFDSLLELLVKEVVDAAPPPN